MACCTFIHSCASKISVLHSAVLLCLYSFLGKRNGFVFEDNLSCKLHGVQESASVGRHSQGIEVREIFCEYFNGQEALHDKIRE